MVSDKLHIFKKHDIKSPRLVLGFSGWMNSAHVSTGSVKWLINILGASRSAGIAPDGFYLYNLPGTMQTAEEFRPHTKIEDGLITYYDEPENIFYDDFGG